MKRSLLLLMVVALVAAFLELADGGAKANAQKTGPAEKARAAENNRADDLALAEMIKRLTDRSAARVAETELPGGGIMADLGGGFQNVMLGRLDGNSEPIAACVTTLEEANDFLGRDLETGKTIGSLSFLRDDISSIARRHGMSVEEYLFYSRMISDAAVFRAMSSPSLSAISIVNNDGTDEGFNDPNPAFVVGEGGNGGTTRGQQRLNVFDFAASIWGAFLDSPITTNVQAQFNPMTPCSSSGGVLGSAGTINVFRDFASAEFPGTWYPSALANKREVSDLSGSGAEINSTFNVNIDSGCLGAGTRFYYGLDNATPPQRINLLVVLLHEMGHGFGFQSFVTGSTGQMLLGFPDVYLRNMFDRTVGLHWHNMSNAQRQASALNTNNVLWDGASVRIASGSLTSGREASTGRVELFTPNPLQSGSSISHYSTAAFPNLLMEPSINPGLPIDLDLSRQQMRDIGWYRDTTADGVADTITNVTPSGGVVVVGDNVNITWVNTGSFNYNVAIDLSTDGGSTFSNIAANVANAGTYSWTVSSVATSQAQIRVREVNFASPAGVSASNFTISLVPSSANVSVSGRVQDLNGRGIALANIRFSDEHGNVFTAVTNAFGFYAVEGLLAGETYIAEASHKRYSFAQRIITANDDLSDIDFVPVQ